MGRLNIELYGIVIGYLEYSDTDTRSFDFIASAEGLSTFSLRSRIISLAVPLEPNSDKRYIQNRRNFFHGIIPEGKTRLNLAQLSGVQPEDTVGLLKARGLDLAGALMIYDDNAQPTANMEAQPVSDKQIGQMLLNDEEFPLGNVRETGRTSLAGFQDKIVLTRKNEQWCLAQNGIPSTHILKPFSKKWPTLIYDEAWSLELARAIGLVNYESYLQNFGGVNTLVIERYDRDSSVPEGRIHQEDFAQAFGIPDEKKYEELGEAWNLERVVDVLYYHASQRDIENFARQIIYALAIGNLDMHAKNIGLLHLPDETMQLTPAYDIPPLLHQGLGENMAFRIDGIIKYPKIKTSHIIKEFLSWEVAPFTSKTTAKDFIITQFENIALALDTVKPHKNAHPTLVADTKANLNRFLLDS
jgi:serine/threonine-protein kinase HipA